MAVSTYHGEKGTSTTVLYGKPDISHFAKGVFETNSLLNLKISITTVLYKAQNE